MTKLLLCSLLSLTAYGQVPHPDPTLTPGAIVTTSKTIICAPGYSKRTRKEVRITTLKRATALYGLSWQPKKYEADHLISLELGGAPNDVRNIWPQAYPSAHGKDKVENALHKAVCKGEITVEEAQKRVVRWWEQ